MSKQQEMHYKSCTPEMTVDFLKGILRNMDIGTEEICYLDSCIGTTSLRVVFKGTDVGTNGKGISPTFARASAYAELFERFQNNLLCVYPDMREHNLEDFVLAPDEKMLTAEEIISQSDAFTRMYFEIRDMKDAPLAEKVERFLNVNPATRISQEGNALYCCLPFYDVKTQKVFYLPQEIYARFYGSNGMSAGNEPKEALIQGLSEIIERVSQRKILEEYSYLPDVPDEYIKQYPYVYKMYEKARNISGYKVIMKDCSFGGKYPVAGLMIIKENTGKFGLKLGCHPDFGVAMERTFTEATQGGDLDAYVERSWVDFSNVSVRSKYNILNSYATGLAQYPYQVIQRKHDVEFVPVKDVSNQSDDEMLKNWLEEIMSEGYDVLIRDVSYLNFPAFHIIIPGLSETNLCQDADLRAYNTKKYVAKCLQTPEKITEDDCKYIVASIGSFKGSVSLDSNKETFAFSNKPIPYKNGAMSTRYMAVLCDVFCGKYEEAIKKMQPMRKALDDRYIEKEELERFNAEFLYLSAYVEMGNHGAVMTYLEELLSDEMLKLIDWIYSNPKEVFVKQYPSLTTLTEEQMTGAQYVMYDIKDKLREGMKKNPIDQNRLVELVLI